MTNLNFFLRLLILCFINALLFNPVFAKVNDTNDTAHIEKKENKNSKNTDSIDYSHRFYREKTIDTETGEKNIKREYVTQTIPGEELIAVALYTYKKEKPTEEVIFTVPIPKEAIYVENSASDSDNVWFSTDNSKRWAKFKDLRVVKKDGTKRIALGKDVTHLQWRLTKPFKYGDTGTLEYKIIIR